jgi:hypothetical protein
MGGQVWKPKIDQQQIEEQKQEKEKSDRAWRTSQYFGSVTGGGGDQRGVNFAAMPKSFIWR